MIQPLHSFQMTDNMHQLQQFIETHGCDFNEWYVGIASNPEAMLFDHHKVNRKQDSWIYRLADSAQTARSIYHRLIEMGCEGKLSASDSHSTIVYVYLRSKNTNP